MGKNLYDRYPAARRVFERAEEVLGMPVRKLCFEGPVEELNRTDVIQPCVMTVCWAAYEVWRESYGLENVSVTAGHSLGEIASLAAAGAISWETALLLVKERGRVMAESAGEHVGMIAIVGLDESKIEGIRTEPLGMGGCGSPTATLTCSSCCPARCVRSRRRNVLPWRRAQGGP